MPRFISPYAGLRLFGGPLGTIRFQDGAYESQHPEEVRWLRQHRGFGVDFFEAGPEPTKPAPPPDAKALQAELEAANAQIEELLKRLAAYETAKTAMAPRDSPKAEGTEAPPEGQPIPAAGGKRARRRKGARGS